MTEPFGCIKRTIRLRSGRYFDFENPSADQFTLADIGGALSKICRFGGQIQQFYSVAEHLTNCSLQAKRDGLLIEECRACFMHDFHEAFIGDIVKPLKIMFPGLLIELEERIDRVIEKKFDVDLATNYLAVKKIDREILIAERRRFFSPDKVEWHGESDVRKINPPLVGWPPEKAEAEFKDLACRFYDLNYDE